MTGWPFWHVTLTVAGVAVADTEIRLGLERLSHEHPFLLSGRYSVDRAEVRYWEEAPDAGVVTSLAQRLWDDHRASGCPCAACAERVAARCREPAGTRAVSHPALRRRPSGPRAVPAPGILR